MDLRLHHPDGRDDAPLLKLDGRAMWLERRRAVPAPGRFPARWRTSRVQPHRLLSASPSWSAPACDLRPCRLCRARLPRRRPPRHPARGHRHHASPTPSGAARSDRRSFPDPSAAACARSPTRARPRAWPQPARHALLHARLMTPDDSSSTRARGGGGGARADRAHDARPRGPSGPSARVSTRRTRCWRSGLPCRTPPRCSLAAATRAARSIARCACALPARGRRTARPAPSSATQHCSATTSPTPGARSPRCSTASSISSSAATPLVRRIARLEHRHVATLKAYLRT